MEKGEGRREEGGGKRRNKCCSLLGDVLWRDLFLALSPCRPLVSCVVWWQSHNSCRVKITPGLSVNHCSWVLCGFPLHKSRLTFPRSPVRKFPLS